MAMDVNKIGARCPSATARHVAQCRLAMAVCAAGKADEWIPPSSNFAIFDCAAVVKSAPHAFNAELTETTKSCRASLLVGCIKRV
ncbi:unnamed protein product [Ceratitis capitata]|uniref:(Mediterranean fruit fly) hypothetical protein n=1 Tax=Ceratitis capitata TaxID=7213 RepID=A0A811V9S7_CERCA|nr:unnamed protein product [Ceratitis capitata]